MICVILSVCFQPLYFRSFWLSGHGQVYVKPGALLVVGVIAEQSGLLSHDRRDVMD